jgi:hypothetical protein
MMSLINGSMRIAGIKMDDKGVWGGGLARPTPPLVYKKGGGLRRFPESLNNHSR